MDCSDAIRCSAKVSFSFHHRVTYILAANRKHHVPFMNRNNCHINFFFLCSVGRCRHHWNTRCPRDQNPPTKRYIKRSSQGSYIWQVLFFKYLSSLELTNYTENITTVFQSFSAISQLLLYVIFVVAAIMIHTEV